MHLFLSCDHLRYKKKAIEAYWEECEVKKGRLLSWKDDLEAAQPLLARPHFEELSCCSQELFALFHFRVSV